MNNFLKVSLKVFRHIIWYVILLIFIILICFFLKYKFMDNIEILDEVVYNFFNNNINSRITSVMKYITLLGSIYVFLFIILIILIFNKNKKYGLFMGINLLWVGGMNQLLKHLFLRERPFSTFVPDISGYSFPSAHAMCSLAFYGFLFILISRNMKSKILKCILFLLMSIFVLAIGISRIYLQVHYFSDVIMGFIFGIICLIIFILILKNFNKMEEL